MWFRAADWDRRFRKYLQRTGNQPVKTKYKDMPEDKYGHTFYYEYGKLVKIEK